MVCSEHSQSFCSPKEFHFDSHERGLNALFHEVLELEVELCCTEGKMEASMETLVATLLIYRAGFDFF